MKDDYLIRYGFLCTNVALAMSFYPRLGKVEKSYVEAIGEMRVIIGDILADPELYEGSDDLFFALMMRVPADIYTRISDEDRVDRIALLGLIYMILEKCLNQKYDPADKNQVAITSDFFKAMSALFMKETKAV